MKQRNKKITERRKRRVLSGIIAVVLVAAMGLGMFLNFETKVQAAPNTVVDPNTTNVWSDIAANSNSTENIGRIWTDKSVFNKNYDFEGALEGKSVTKGENADFMVGLSAMSSTSNLKSTTSTVNPLDIVLVLDDSGSMDDPMGENGWVYSYEEVAAQDVVESHGHMDEFLGQNTASQDTTGGEYYALIGNEYVRINEVTERHYGTWNVTHYDEHVRWELNGQTVTPDTTQFYTQNREWQEAPSRTEALQQAVNSFIDQAAATNATIANQADKIRISIVVFAGSSDIENSLTICEGDNNVNALKNTVRRLNGNGATNAGAGMSDANSVLRNANRDAEQLVIFFTDGVPTTSSSFNTGVANTAVNNAAEIKGRGGTVYSIGIFDGADPSVHQANNNSNETTKANTFMNAVSSNYPNATSWNQLGQRVNEEGAAYYKATSDSAQLSQIFQDIFDKETEDIGSGSPIEEQQGAAGTPGVLTFKDTLGSYMEVTGVGTDNNKMYLAFADGLHEGTTTDGGRTWQFSGVVNDGNEDHGVNEAYPEGADLSTIKVTVDKSDDLETGDIITVEIPASLIPMRHYDVDTDNDTMTVSDTYPIRLFYGVSLKEAAEAALENPQDENYAALVKSQTSENGKTIDFYSNNFIKGAQEGTTEATFTPSDGNKFYYYPVNTQLFTNEDCTQPATRSNIGGFSTLYYKDSYWQLTGTGNEVEEVPVTGSITRSGNDWNVTYQDNNAYIAANTPRADRPATLVSNKGQNLTETALTVLTPTWVGTNVSQKLGNNGKLSFPAPGELEIKKTVEWGNASDETKTDKNSFKFTVHLYTEGEDGTQTNLTGQYPYAIYETGEDPIENGTGTISDDGEITLKNGQRVVISDLPDGVKFTVEEQEANENGFTTTDSYANAAEGSATNDGKVEGTIVGGSKESVAFTNSYHADEVSLGTEQAIKVQKNLTGREWQDTDEFRFTMKAEGNAPTPESVEAVVVDDEDKETDYTVELSNITFENPGEYTYVIEEDNDTNPIAGIDYSNETYAVTITVKDNGTGKLEITNIAFEQRADIDGNEPAEQPDIQNNTVVFTNQYNAEKATTNLNGIKDYTDNSGANLNAQNKFTFELKAIGGYATDGGSAQTPTIDAADVPMPEGADAGTHTITIGNK